MDQSQQSFLSTMWDDQTRTLKPMCPSFPLHVVLPSPTPWVSSWFPSLIMLESMIPREQHLLPKVSPSPRTITA